MIFGHEGLPRSGKSLEAMKHVCDSMMADRTVVTNIAGISHEAIAEYLAIPLPTIKRLLICLEPPEAVRADEEKVVPWVKAEFLKHAVNDCLWIWDEINQFWPPDRQPLNAEWAKFVTEHGHKGIDILIMGQDLTELHQTWRKRLQRYTRFTKLDMVGKEDHYHWASYTSVGRLKFRRTADGKRPYNKAYFGFYKSHEADTTNKGNYKDTRFAIFQRKHKLFALAFVVLLGWCIWYFLDFFNPEPHGIEVEETTAAAPAPAQQIPKAPATTVSEIASEVVTVEVAPIDYLDGFASKYDLRLAGLIVRSDPQAGKAVFDFQLDFVDPGYRVKERMNRADVASLGWAIEHHPYGIKITKENKSYIARAWPLDNQLKVPKQSLADMKPGA